MDEAKYEIPRIWTNDKKGLKKELISFKFKSVVKANDLSKCSVILSEVEGLQDHHETDILRKGNNVECLVELGRAITPIDCYVELFLKKMAIGEKSRCSITTKSGQVISFVLLMMHIDFDGYYYSKSLQEIVELAQLYKDNGVKMFKKYPLFAQEYFNRAAKLLITCLPFDTLAERELGKNGADPEQLQRLLENIQMNVAACLIKQQRYDEVLHVLEFAKRTENVPEKAIYRRALSCYHLGLLEEAKEILEQVNHHENKEFNALHTNVMNGLKKSNENYSKMVKKMFS